MLCSQSSFFYRRWVPRRQLLQWRSVVSVVFAIGGSFEPIDKQTGHDLFFAKVTPFFPKKSVMDAALNSMEGTLIEAFVEWEHCLVRIEYPNSTSAWIRCGGSYSQIRWALRDQHGQDVLQLVMKHSACLNAPLVMPLCIHCQNRKVWKRRCITPQNLFYILRVQDKRVCQLTLDPFIRARVQTTSDEVILMFTTSQPVVATRSKQSGKQSARPSAKRERDQASIDEPLPLLATHEALQKAAGVAKQEVSHEVLQEHERRQEEELERERRNLQYEERCKLQAA